MTLPGIDSVHRNGPLPGRPGPRIRCPWGCNGTWRDDQPMRPAVLRMGSGLGVGRPVAIECHVCGRAELAPFLPAIADLVARELREREMPRGMIGAAA